jgi:signal transduction histidine kinase
VRWAIRLTDIVALFFVLLAYLQVGNPDILFHCLWVVLAVQAFLFGLRFSLARIAVSTLLVIGYPTFEVAIRPVGANGLELTEWPLMVTIAIIVAVMADRVNQATRHFAALYRQASDRLLAAQQEERKRLARDLHDGVGQTLAALALTLDAASGALTTAEAAPRSLAAAPIRRAQELIADALEEARDVSFQLRPERFPETGLAAAISELVARSPIRTEVTIEPGLTSPTLLAPIAQIEVFRIVQEALGNAVRHSRARQVWIGMSMRGDRLVVEVRDDGIGFDPRSADDGLGLGGMRDRAALLGAKLEIRSRPGGGTIVRLGLPHALARAGSPDPVVGAASPVPSFETAVDPADTVAPRARARGRARRAAALVAERARHR